MFRAVAAAIAAVATPTEKEKKLVLFEFASFFSRGMNNAYSLAKEFESPSNPFAFSLTPDGYDSDSPQLH